ncbi:MAG: BON domain-containing protein [Granulicella sp.]
MHVTKSFSLPRLAAIATLAFTFAVSGCKSTPPPDDNAVNTALQAKLTGDTALATEPIHTLVQTGVAILQGTVSSEAAKALAGNDASQVPGVKSVVNQLTVQTAKTAPPTPTPPPPPTPVAKPAPPASPTKPVPVTAKKKPTPRLTPEQAQYGVASAAPAPPPQPVYQPAPIERRPLPPPVPQVPPPPPAPRIVTLLSGTPLSVRITQTLDSATTQPGDSFSGTLTADVMADGIVALPAGTNVSGRVDEVHEAGHFKGNSLLTISLVAINRRGESITISTDPYTETGKGRGANTAAKVGGGAAIGAIIGGILGGGKGAAIGAGAGGGLGAGAQSITRGEQVQIPSETLLRFRLTTSVEVRTSSQRPRDSDTNLQQRNSN